MEVIQVTKKGRYMNSIERFHIFCTQKENKHMNEVLFDLKKTLYLRPFTTTTHNNNYLITTTEVSTVNQPLRPQMHPTPIPHQAVPYQPSYKIQQLNGVSKNT
jgi:hypothetical protein